MFKPTKPKLLVDFLGGLGSNRVISWTQTEGFYILTTHSCICVNDGYLYHYLGHYTITTHMPLENNKKKLFLYISPKWNFGYSTKFGNFEHFIYMRKGLQCWALYFLVAK